ncbi:hypothetical protein OQA88_11476 [Cercophora sp. LCS_1]
MTSRLCPKCSALLTGPQCLQQALPHHQSTDDALVAARGGCYVCGVIVHSAGWKSAVSSGKSFNATSFLSKLAHGPSNRLKLTIDAIPEELSESEDDDTGDDFTLPTAPLWGFLLSPVEDVRDNVGDYTPSAKTLGNSEFFNLPLSWLADCDANHSSCQAKISGYYPTRLLEILSNDLARVIITADHSMQGRYASLSHCWGKAKTLKLLQSNIGQLRAGVDIDTLPQSYREAIAVCREYKFRYIWIDSLCIIQDSREDWEREAVTMKDVYQNSVLNIAAAAAAESSDSSFLSRDPDFIRPVKAKAQWDGLPHREYYLIDESIYTDDIESSPLHQRGWVVQEVYLTPRTLSLTRRQLWWECREFIACETYPGGVPAGSSALDPGNLTRYGAPSNLEKPHRAYSELVERFTSCLLTFPLDKMVAFSGIAQHFQGFFPGDQYLAGVWRSQLPQALHWSTHRIRPCYRPDEYRAPSWSWASVEGPVRPLYDLNMVDQGTLATLCVVQDVAVHHINPGNKAGLLRGGYIKLKAPLARVGIIDSWLSLEVSPGEWDLIKGSDEEAGDPDRRGSFSLAELDECTPAGDPAVSYLDLSTEQAYLSGQMDKLIRVKHAFGAGESDDESLGFRFFALTIMSWAQDGKPFREGSLLLSREEWPRYVYQRVGFFTVAGDITVDALEARNSEESIIIV